MENRHVPDSGSRIRPPRSPPPPPLARPVCPPGPSGDARDDGVLRSLRSLSACLRRDSIALQFHLLLSLWSCGIASASQRFVFLLFCFPPQKVRILFWFWRNLISCLGPSPPRLFELLQRQSPFAPFSFVFASS